MQNSDVKNKGGCAGLVMTNEKNFETFKRTSNSPNKLLYSVTSRKCWPLILDQKKSNLEKSTVALKQKYKSFYHYFTLNTI